MILQILTCVDKAIGPAICIPKRIQHLLLECSPVSLNVSAHLSDNRVSNIAAFHTVVWDHRNGIGAGGIGTGEGGDALIHVEECRHVGAKKDRRASTKRKWHQIPGVGRSPDGLNI